MLGFASKSSVKSSGDKHFIIARGSTSPHRPWPHTALGTTASHPQVQCCLVHQQDKSMERSNAGKLEAVWVSLPSLRPRADPLLIFCLGFWAAIHFPAELRALPRIPAHFQEPLQALRTPNLQDSQPTTLSDPDYLLTDLISKSSSLQVKSSVYELRWSRNNSAHNTNLNLNKA